MKKFICKNTKDNSEAIYYGESEVIKLFESDHSREYHILKAEYNEYLAELEENIKNAEDEDEKSEAIEAKEAYIAYWDACGRYIEETTEDYCKAIIEDEEWCSPRGVEPVFRLVEVVE